METKTRFSLVKAVLTVFVLSLISLPGQLAVAGDLVNATDTVDSSTLFQTDVAADVASAATTLVVEDASGFIATDVILITDGTNAETATIDSISSNDLTLSAGLTNGYAAGVTRVNVLSGITHTFQFDTSTTADIDTVRITLDAAAIADGGSLNGVTFGALTGITEEGVPAHDNDQAGFVDFDADNSNITAGTTIAIPVQLVRNPDGTTQNTYSVDVETLDDGDNVIDSVTVFFVVDGALTVSATVDSTLTVTIADDGTQNNSSDSTTDDGAVALGTLAGSITDNATTGRGLDGILVTVNTNAANGYSATVHSSDNGLVNDQHAGGGRGGANGIDDIAAPGALSADGTEVYAFTTGATLNAALDGTYRAFTDSSAPFEFGSSAGPISNDQTVITVAVKISGTTESGVYRDVLTIIVTPEF